MQQLNLEMKNHLSELVNHLTKSYEKIKESAQEDIKIDEFDLDREVLRTPNIVYKYNNLFTDHTINLKDLYSLKEKTKLERWRYWSGKQTDRYYADNGIVHEKILKSDLDIYLNADEKLTLINEAIAVQKAIVDYLERTIKELNSRNFHCKVALDWRKFTSGS